MFSGELALQADSRPNRPQRQVPSTTRTCNLQLLTRNALLAFPTERLWRVDAQTAERRTPCAPRHVIHPHKRKQTTRGQNTPTTGNGASSPPSLERAPQRAICSIYRPSVPSPAGAERTPQDATVLDGRSRPVARTSPRGADLRAD